MSKEALLALKWMYWAILVGLVYAGPATILTLWLADHGLVWLGAGLTVLCAPLYVVGVFMLMRRAGVPSSE